MLFFTFNLVMLGASRTVQTLALSLTYNDNEINNILVIIDTL